MTLNNADGHYGMTRRSLVKHHLLEAIRDGLAKTTGNEDSSRSLRDEARLRLIRMPEEELWELVKLTASSPQRPVPGMAVVDKALPTRNSRHSEDYTVSAMPYRTPSLKGAAKGGCKM